MKCNKCGYTSFDYNQNCPKCNYDLVAEATKMNLSSYSPSPPYLLASLLGGKDEYISVAPSQDHTESQSDENSGISMMDDIGLPQRTILPGLAEAVAELGLNIAGNNQQTPATAAGLESGSTQGDGEDVFEFVLDDDEQPKGPELKVESEPVDDSQEIELTMVSENDEDEQTQLDIELTPEKKNP